MKRMLLFTSLLALGLGAAAQTSPATSAMPANNQSSQPILTSNGPVTLDYKNPPIQSNDPVDTKIAQQVRHELLKLPYYGMFDDIEYTVQGRTVTLRGAVTSLH